ncbi:MAG: DUF1015 domain-containing protein [Eubacteriales bacterium]|jgi:hypothetical protein|nr:DUF1015 domain-containing protein [Clostridiales bacterium]
MPIETAFVPADILLPKAGFEKWSCVACDQYTSEPEYWQAVEELVGDAPSAYRLILPEAFLDSSDVEARIGSICKTMQNYIDDGVFAEYKDAYVYVERTMPGGGVRRGLVGCLDLEEYDYTAESRSLVRATEGTVLSRIPPRVRIRENAPLELPHIMVLINDPGRTVIEPLESRRGETLYDFELMMGGGHLRGWLVDRSAYGDISRAISALAKGECPLVFAMGDGNHSLATAKACYEAEKAQTGRSDLPSRYALVELVNIHDEALVFEPIYRVIFGVDPKEVETALRDTFSFAGEANVEFVTQAGGGSFYAPGLVCGTVQEFIDGYIATRPDATVDYIHGEDVVRRLCAERADTVGFIFDGIGKSELFEYVESRGPLPRKTFSMGEAAGKRYYTEARRIKL